MGQPAVPTPEHRERVLTFARGLIEAVGDDVDDANIPQTVFDLAVELVDTRRALDVACELLRRHEPSAAVRMRIDRLQRLNFDQTE